MTNQQTEPDDLLDLDWVSENYKKEPHCFALPVSGFFLYLNVSGHLHGVWTIFFVEPDGDETTICHVLKRSELKNVLRVLDANLNAVNAIVTIRDNILHERGPLSEAGFDSDKINAVLSVIDDATSDLDATFQV